MNPNGSAPYSRVVEVRAVDPADTRRWITWTTGYADPKPATGSAAAKWMASTETEVDTTLVPSVLFSAPVAAKVAALCRRIRRGQGYIVLPGRIYRGSSKMLPVTIDGQRFRSLRQAARVLGVGRWTIWSRFRL